MEVIFSRNKDRRTCNMFVDNFLINEDIPFIPSKAVDHRGAALFFFCKENSLEWADVTLDEATEQPSEVERGFVYMYNPVEVAVSINERLAIKNQRSISITKRFN